VVNNTATIVQVLSLSIYPTRHTTISSRLLAPPIIDRPTHSR